MYSELRLTRDLQFVIDGAETKGVVFIGEIKEIKTGQWACHWSISFVHPAVAMVYGDDPLDAFLKCAGFVGSLLSGSEDDGLEFWWQYKGDHGGFWPKYQ